MTPKKTRRTAICPGCGKERNVDEQRSLVEAAERAGDGDVQWQRSMALRASGTDHCPRMWSWACDRCLREGRAVSADPAKQNTGMGARSAHYVDRPFTCEDCGAREVFTARQQLRWYEVLGFIRDAHPKQCFRCRRKRRAVRDAHEALGELLPLADRANEEELLRIAGLYDVVGSESKADAFRRRAANRAKRDR